MAHTRVGEEMAVMKVTLHCMRTATFRQKKIYSDMKNGFDKLVNLLDIIVDEKSPVSVHAADSAAF